MLDFYFTENTLEELAEQYLQFSGGQVTLNEAYMKKYGTALEEDSINHNVKMVIVASKMDDSTERIIRYLRDKYEVDINIMFFKVVSCGSKRLISRAWFEENVEEQRPDPKSIRQWNQEYYVSFGSGGRYDADSQWGDILAAKTGWTAVAWQNRRKIPSSACVFYSDIDLHIGILGINALLHGQSLEQADDRLEHVPCL